MRARGRCRRKHYIQYIISQFVPNVYMNIQKNPKHFDFFSAFSAIGLDISLPICYNDWQRDVAQLVARRRVKITEYRGVAQLVAR